MTHSESTKPVPDRKEKRSPSDGSGDPSATGGNRGSDTAAEAEGGRDSHPPSPLLACLERVARWHGIEFQENELVSGLPLEGENLTPTLLMRASLRIGLKARLVKRPLKKLPASLLPAIVLLKDNEVGVLEPGPDGSEVDLFEPDPEREESGGRPCSAADLKRRYSGYAILLRPSTDDAPLPEQRPEFATAASRRSWFWRTAWQFRGYYFRLLPASLLVNLFALAMPFFVMLVYDRVVPNDAEETLWVLAAGVTIIFVFEFLMRLMRGYTIEHAGKEMDQVMASALFEQLMALEMSARPASGASLAGRLKAYETLRQFFMSASILALADVPFGLLMIGVIFYLGGPLGWILVITGTLAIAFECLIQFPMRRAVHRSAASGVERQAFISESVGGLESIKASSAEGVFQGRLERMMADSSVEEVRSHWYSLLGNSTTTFLLHLTTIGLIVGGVFLVYEGDLSMGGLIACVLLGARAMTPLAMVAGLMTRLQQALASLGELNGVMSLPRESGEDRRFTHRRNFAFHYSLRDVSMKYPDQAAPALDGLTLEIKPGERIALLGRIGSGKTTLLRILAGLYHPDRGETLLDGIELSQYHPAVLRRRIGYLPQDATLFSGTLRDNVTLGLPGIRDGLVLKAVARAGLTEFVHRNPAGLHAPVGERGVLLSGGQRQGIVLARALITEPSLLLLDEPTSGIDLQSEAQVLAALGAYLDEDRSRTLIISSHKLSILSLVDRIVVMDQGKVVADGEKAAVLNLLKMNAASKAPQGREENANRS